MKLFLDTANLDDLRRWSALGLVDGATTNPALLAREGGDPLAHLCEVARRVDGPVSAQVTHADAHAMVAQGRALAALAPNIVVKVPATQAGYAAAAELTRGAVACNVTLTFHPAQAIPFLRLGVRYVSLIVGRVEDFGFDAKREVERARALIDRLGSETKLLVASLRNPEQILAAILGGADVLTVPPSTWALVHQNPLTLQGQEDFSSAWRGLPAEARRGYEELGAQSAPRRTSTAA
jgi:transaldolase